MFLSVIVTLNGVYRKKYLNTLECYSYFNLVLLSALAAVYQNNEDSKQVISIISVSVALAYFCGIL